MRLAISHTTTYRYDEPVRSALQQIRLTPTRGPDQEVLEWATVLSGAVAELSYEDQHRNVVELIRVAPGTSELVISSTGEVETTDLAGVVSEHDGLTPLWLFRRTTPLTEAGNAIRRLVADLDSSWSTDLDGLHGLANRIAETVAYEIGATNIDMTGEAALNARAGVCQDHAHIFISAARLLGFPARYVSGYLMMNDRVDQDATHAWAQAWVDGLGWVGFDVSNGISPDSRYVRIATGLDYREAAPIRGVRVGEGDETLEVAIAVQQ